jgi:hypothetical protein
MKFKDCDFDHFLNYRNNSMLNFGEMNLDCILLGLAILFTSSNHGADKVILEIVVPTNAFYYQRYGKWKSEKLLDLKTTKRHSNLSAIKKSGLDKHIGSLSLVNKTKTITLPML